MQYNLKAAAAALDEITQPGFVKQSAGLGSALAKTLENTRPAFVGNEERVLGNLLLNRVSGRGGGIVTKYAIPPILRAHNAVNGPMNRRMFMAQGLGGLLAANRALRELPGQEIGKTIGRANSKLRDVRDTAMQGTGRDMLGAHAIPAAYVLKRVAPKAGPWRRRALTGSAGLGITGTAAIGGGEWLQDLIGLLMGSNEMRDNERD